MNSHTAFLNDLTLGAPLYIGEPERQTPRTDLSNPVCDEQNHLIDPPEVIWGERTIANVRQSDVPNWVPEHSVEDWYDAKPWVREVYVLLHKLESTADSDLFDCVNGFSTLFGAQYGLWVGWTTDWSYTAKQFREDFLKIERIAPSQSAVYAMAHALKATVERLTSK